MLGGNIALITPRQFKEQSGAFVTNSIAGHKTVSAFDINYFFPLYTHPQTIGQDLFSQKDSGERLPNLAPKLVEAIKSAFKKEPTPEQIFHYIYAILYSKAYRKKYTELLKTDFPRAPFTKDYKLFKGQVPTEWVNLTRV
jgi:predicted helicase